MARLRLVRSPLARTPGALLLAGLLLAPGRLAAQEGGGNLPALDSLLATPVSAAAKYERTATEAASSVTVITHEQIERFGHRTLTDILAGVSGFFLSNDRNYSYLGARGFGRPTDYNNRILLLVNGHQVGEGIWGSSPMELPILPENIERVEVVRGPGSALYGTGAVFGVINIVTRAGASVDGAQAEVRTGSFGRRGGAVLLGRRTAPGVDLALSGMWDGNDGQDLYYPEFDRPETNGGLAHNLDWERRWRIHGRAIAGDWSFQAWLSERTKAIPTASYAMRFGEDSWTADRYGFAELRYERRLDASRQIRIRGFYDQYRYEGLYAYEPAQVEVGRGDMVGTEIVHGWDITSAHRLTVGGELRRHLRAKYAYDWATPRAQGFDIPWSSGAVFAEHEFQAARSLTLLAGARFDDQTTAPATVSPRAAVLFTPARGTTLKLLYGRAVRAPNVYEAMNEGDSYRRNPDLREEEASTLEAVWQQRLGRGLLATASMFDYHVHGLIDLTVDPLDEAYVYRNVGRTHARGTELGLEARFRGVAGYANYTYQVASDESTGERLTNSPAHLAKAGASVELTRRVGLALEGRYESSRRTVYDTRTDDVGLANLHLWYSPESRRAGDDQLVVSIRVNNLLDAAYATPGGVEHVQDAIRQDGRTVSAELRYRF